MSKKARVEAGVCSGWLAEEAVALSLPFLPQQDVCKAARVSTTLRASAASVMGSWKHLTLSRPPSARGLACVVSRAPFLQGIDLNCSRLDSLEALAPVAPALRTLDVYGAAPEALRGLLQAGTSLTAVTLRGIEVEDTTVFLELVKNKPHLESLELLHCPSVPPALLGRLGPLDASSMVTPLKRLTMNLDSSGVRALMALVGHTSATSSSSTLRNLEALSIAVPSPMGNDLLITIATHCKRMKDLFIRDSVDHGAPRGDGVLTNEALAALASLPVLDRLSVVSDVSVRGVNDLGMMMLLAGRPLSHLKLNGFPKFTGASLEMLFATSGSKLRTVHVQGACLAPRIAVSPLPNLEILNLSQSRTTDCFLVRLLPLCTALVEINLTHCEEVSDDTLVAIRDNLPMVKTLVLSGTAVRGRAAFDRPGAAPQVSRIVLRGCVLEPKRGLPAVLAAFTSSPGQHFLVHSLDLQGVDAVDDAAVAVLAAACVRLRLLVLANNPSITSDAVAALATRGCCRDAEAAALPPGALPSPLEELDVSYCRRVGVQTTLEWATRRDCFPELLEVVLGSSVDAHHGEVLCREVDAALKRRPGLSVELFVT